MERALAVLLATVPAVAASLVVVGHASGVPGLVIQRSVLLVALSVPGLLPQER